MGFTVSVFGLGFVGLTTALGLAEKGNKVFGIDVDKQRTDLLASGKLPFVEPGLGEALIQQTGKNFFLANDPAAAVKESDFVFLCVGTPCGEAGQADLTYIYSALDMFLDVLKDEKFRVIVIKSTVPPSTTQDKVIPYLLEKGFGLEENFRVANNPEFLREGKCWEDFMNPDRIVCGVQDEQAAQHLELLYRDFAVPVHFVSLNTAEFIKYLSNTLLATMISYSNEMSKIADLIGNIEIKQAFQILHQDKRWGDCNMKSYVYPGCGYGGYCLPKDTKAVYSLALHKGFEANILKNVIDINESMPEFMARQVEKLIDNGDRIAILGLSFKPHSDDVRDTASAKIIKYLQSWGYDQLLAYDPIANAEFKKCYSDLNVVYYDQLDKIIQDADIVVIATAWPEFINIDKKYSDKKFVDCRYFL